jgi:hypothetical protein
MIGVRHPMFRTLAAALIAAAIALGWTIWGEMHATRLMGDVGPGKGHYVVTLNFPPEGFHTTRLQAIGRVVEVKGPSVYLMDVDNSAMRAFATAYWVREVQPWQGR